MRATPALGTGVQDGSRLVPSTRGQAALSISLLLAGVAGGFSGFGSSVILVPLLLLAERTVF